MRLKTSLNYLKLDKVGASTNQFHLKWARVTVKLQVAKWLKKVHLMTVRREGNYRRTMRDIRDHQQGIGMIVVVIVPTTTHHIIDGHGAEKVLDHSCDQVLGSMSRGPHQSVLMIEVTLAAMTI
jgi:glyceraldehyde-3-phosphate dehydrogenase/erythrose-4-phosphate dehydrogenase